MFDVTEKLYGVQPLRWLKVLDPEWEKEYEIAEIRFGGHYRLTGYGQGITRKFSASYHNGIGYDFLFGVDGNHHHETYVYGEQAAKNVVQAHYERWVKALLILEQPNEQSE